MFPSFVDRPRTLGILVGLDQKDSSMVALVVSNGSYVLAGIAGDDAFRAVFPSVFVWPRCLASWSVWARRTVMPCRRSSVGTISRAHCIRQSLVRCLVCLMSSGFGFWEMISWKTRVFCVPGSTVDDVHASFYRAFCTLSHIFYVRMDLGSWSPRIQQSPGGVCLEECRKCFGFIGR